MSKRAAIEAASSASGEASRKETLTAFHAARRNAKVSSAAERSCIVRSTCAARDAYAACVAGVVLRGALTSEDERRAGARRSLDTNKNESRVKRNRYSTLRRLKRGSARRRKKPL